MSLLSILISIVLVMPIFMIIFCCICNSIKRTLPKHVIVSLPAYSEVDYELPAYSEKDSNA